MPAQATWDDPVCLWDDPAFDWNGNYIGIPLPGPIPPTYVPVNQGGTFYLRILLQALFTYGNRTVRDINGNYYPIAVILYSGNDELLNSIVYYEPNAKRITCVANFTNIDLDYINLWANANVPGGPQVSIPPPVFDQVAPMLYDVSSPV
jgi:hypothetical protein